MRSNSQSTLAGTQLIENEVRYRVRRYSDHDVNRLTESQRQQLQQIIRQYIESLINNAPPNRPSWLLTDGAGWPIQPAGNYPKVFNRANNKNPNDPDEVPEQYHSYEANGKLMVTVYRFAQPEPVFSESPLRRSRRGSFSEHSPSEMTDMASHQTHYGGSSAVDNPFVSVTTDHQKLYSNSEVWVQKLLDAEKNQLGTFEVPVTSLFRPRVVSSITRLEQEWLYYDDKVRLTRNTYTFRRNPYATT